jgi:hypothetical protein
VAIFSSAPRARTIAERLNRSGGEAVVRPGDDPADPSFVVVLRFADSPEGYRAVGQVIQTADLADLVTVPRPH